MVTMRSKELWLVEKNHATVKPYSTRASLLGMKTYSESRIELQNLQILKKMLEKSSQGLSSEQPCEPKSFDVAFKVAGIERRVNDGGDFCLLWFVILKSVWYSVEQIWAAILLAVSCG